MTAQQKPKLQPNPQTQAQPASAPARPAPTTQAEMDELVRRVAEHHAGALALLADM